MKTPEIKEQSEHDPNIYEIGYLLVPTIAEDRVLDDVNAIKNTVESLQGLLISDGGLPELITLAYPMTKTVANKNTHYESGYFGWVKFHARPDILPALTKSLEENAQVIRFLLITTVKENTVLPKRFGMAPRKREEHSAPGGAETPILTAAEIDKTVDELISTATV